jgi:hypothetical protein
MKVAVEWTTTVVEHHRAIVEYDDLPVEARDALEARSDVDGELEFDDMSFVVDVEDRGQTLKHDDVENRYVSRMTIQPPEPAEVGYHPHDGIAAAEYGASSQAGLASYGGPRLVVSDGVVIARTERIDIAAVDPGAES